MSTLRDFAPEKSDALCEALGDVFSEMITKKLEPEEAWWMLFMFLCECYQKITQPMHIESQGG